MSKSNKPDYCPDWFNLSDYEILNQFTANHFYYLANLYRDKSYLLNSSSETFDDFEQIEHIRLLLNQMAIKNYQPFKKILPNLSQEKFERDILQTPSLELFYSDKTQLGAILGLANSIKQIDHLLMNGYAEVEKGTKSLKSMNISVNIDDIIENFNPSNDLCFYVNLDYSDDAIIEELKKRLRKHRAKNEGKQYTDAKIKSLIDNRVFPYIDLLLWGKLTGNELTQSQMANLLFPDLYDIDIVNKLRLLTIPKAEQILNGEIKFI